MIDKDLKLVERATGEKIFSLSGGIAPLRKQQSEVGSYS